VEGKGHEHNIGVVAWLRNPAQVPAAEFISKKGMKSVNNLLDE
jgi:hypothetical protein